jgi:hypothetical protein
LLLALIAGILLVLWIQAILALADKAGEQAATEERQRVEEKARSAAEQEAERRGAELVESKRHHEAALKAVEGKLEAERKVRAALEQQLKQRRSELVGLKRKHEATMEVVKGQLQAEKKARAAAELETKLLRAPKEDTEPKDANAVLNKAIKAAGGRENLSKFRAATWKREGTFSDDMGHTHRYSEDWAMQVPRQMKVHNNDVSDGRVLDGDKGWTVTMGAVEEMDKEKLAQAQAEMYTMWVLTLLPLETESGFKLEALGESQVDNRPAVGVKVTHKDYTAIDLYFDKESGLLVKTIYKTAGSMGKPLTLESMFSDYKDFQGIKQPTKIVQNLDGKPFLLGAIIDYKPQENLDPKTFAKPEK